MAKRSGTAILLSIACAIASADTAQPRRAGAATPHLQPLTMPRRPGFEVNRGQWPGSASYVARDGAAMLFLAPDQAVWRFRAGSSERRSAEQIRMRWLGANPSPAIAGADPRAARVNYARGRDQAGWHFNVPLFERVVYRELYAGIDLVFHDRRGELEYDLVAAPGADPDAVRLRFDSPRRATLADGALVLAGDDGTVIHRRPIAYQEIGGSRHAVTAEYRIAGAPGGDGRSIEIAFALGAYDRAHPLIIDPSVAYVTKVDPLLFTDNVVDSAVDGDGNLWLAGMTSNPDFPVTDGAIDETKSELDDGYVVKVDAAGEVVYATYLGGSFYNCLSAVDVDADGNAFVAGTTNSNDFPVTAGAAQATYADGQGDGFLTKLGPDGQLLYSTYFGGNGSEQCSGRGQRYAGVAVAPDGSAYLIVSISTSTQIPAPGGVRATIDADFYIVRFDPDLVVQWGRFLGSPGATEQTLRVRTDAAGNAYVLGRTAHILGAEHEFPVTAGAFQTTSESDAVSFVAKFAADGDLAYATFFGATSGNDSSQFHGDLDVDAAGNAYVVVSTGTNGMPVTSGAYQTEHKGFGDLFIGKLDPTGSTLLYGTYLGGTSAEQPNLQAFPLAVNDAGNVYVGGYTFSSDFPQRDALDVTDRSNFVVKLATDGTDVVYATYLPQGIHTLAVAGDAVYVAGRNLDGIGIGAARIDDGGAAPACAGDCDGSGDVFVNEVIVGVGIALGQQLISACLAFDTNDDGMIGIAELIAGVNALLGGCS